MSSSSIDFLFSPFDAVHSQSMALERALDELTSPSMSETDWDYMLKFCNLVLKDHDGLELELDSLKASLTFTSFKLEPFLSQALCVSLNRVLILGC